MLSGSPFPQITAQELALQLSGMRKAEKKLPTWFSSGGIIYPAAVNLEQTSSETTANYKASLIEGDSIVDITGGFGVDSFYFSKRFRKVVHCELNADLAELVDHNSKELKADNLEVRQGDGLEFLEKVQKNFSWIYVDPSRRDDSGGKVFRLSDCLPDVPQHLSLLFDKAPGVLIKTSPLLDIKAGLRELSFVQEIHIIAVENEVKELLWVLRRPELQQKKIVTVNLRKGQQEIFESQWDLNLAIAYSEPRTFLYEPNAAIMKSGMFNALGKSLNLPKLHPNTHLFTSDAPIDFPGRRFKIIEQIAFKGKRTSLPPKRKANISTRNFPLNVAELKKMLNIKDGGNLYLFFTTDLSDKKIILLCEKY